MENNTFLQVFDNIQISTTSLPSCSRPINILNSSLLHQSRIDVEQRASEPANTNFSLSSHPPIFKDNKMIKVSELFVDGKIIRIVDTFTNIDKRQNEEGYVKVQQKQFSQPPESLPLEKEGQGKYAKRLIKSKKQQHEKRDVRSTVKNIFRIFVKWVESYTPLQLKLQPALRALLNKTGKYNNRLIVEISQHDQLRRAFLTFCQDDAKEGIINSRITDKESHLEALQSYKQICMLVEQEQKSSQQVMLPEQFVKIQEPEQPYIRGV